MTMGPAPMIRIEEMSVRLGMVISRARSRPRHEHAPHRQNAG
jgi:hypothetical protein